MGILRSSNERDVTKMGHAGRRERARRTGKRNKENGNNFNKELEMNFLIGLRFKLAFVPIFFPDPLALSSLPVPCFSKIPMKGFSNTIIVIKGNDFRDFGLNKGLINCRFERSLSKTRTNRNAILPFEEVKSMATVKFISVLKWNMKENET